MSCSPSFHSNARTAHYKAGTPIPTKVTIQPDRTFTFETRSPPVAHLLRTTAGITVGSSAAPSVAVRVATSGGSTAAVPTTGSSKKDLGPNAGFVGKISVKQVYEIAKIKMIDEDLRALGLERVARSVVGSARTMGLQIVD